MSATQIHTTAPYDDPMALADVRTSQTTVSDIISAWLFKAHAATSARERSECRQGLLAIEQMAAQAVNLVGEWQERRG